MYKGQHKTHCDKYSINNLTNVIKYLENVDKNN